MTLEHKQRTVWKDGIDIEVCVADCPACLLAEKEERIRVLEAQAQERTASDAEYQSVANLLADAKARIDVLEAQIDAAVMAERKVWQGRESERYRQALMKRVTHAEARIDRAKGLPEKWRKLSENHGKRHSFTCICDIEQRQCADELLAALGDEK
jgi:hypothetical protein